MGLKLIIENYEPQKIEEGKTIRYEFELGRERYSVSSKRDFLEKFGLALLKYPYAQIDIPELNEEIYGRRFIHQIKIRAGLHNHTFKNLKKLKK